MSKGVIRIPPIIHNKIQANSKNNSLVFFTNNQFVSKSHEHDLNNFNLYILSIKNLCRLLDRI